MILPKLFSINILIVALVESQQVVENPNEFKILKNQNINMTVNESSLISSNYKPSRMQCMAFCSTNINCLTAAYDNSQGRLTNCFTYNRYFQTSELIPSSTGVVYQKKSSKIYFNFFILHQKPLALHPDENIRKAERSFISYVS
jgi:hypothetical protein